MNNIVLYSQEGKEAFKINIDDTKKATVAEVIYDSYNYHYAAVKLFTESQIKIEVRKTTPARDWSDMYLFDKKPDGKFVLKEIDGNIFGE